MTGINNPFDIENHDLLEDFYFNNIIEIFKARPLDYSRLFMEKLKPVTED